MKKNTLLSLTLIFCIQIISFAQKPNSSSFQVKGKVTEKETNTAMEYCTVSLYNTKDNSLVTGTITDLEGNFNIQSKKPGAFFLKVSFIGFETKQINGVNLNPKAPIFDAGNIMLGADAEQIDDVKITATRSTLRYEIDKKVISIDKNIAAEAGSAVDVLESTPSIQVDADGTVKLRGNSNFMVLVDGKPTALSGSEALQQIPAINIKNIELITNPSAKYQSGNSAGIINIILKEQKVEGTSGLISVNAGTFNTYGGNINIKHVVKKFTFDFSARLRNRGGPREASDSLYTSTGDEIIAITEGERGWTFGGYNFNYAVGYKIAKSHNITAEMVYGKWYMLADDDRSLRQTNLTKGETSESKNINDAYRGSPYFGPSLSYSGSFKNESKLSAYIGYSQSDFSEEVLNDNFSLDDQLLSGTMTNEKAFNNRITSKIDYTLPIKTGKLEFGGQANNAMSRTKSRAFDLNIADLSYTETEYNNSEVDFKRSIYGLYTTYGNKYKKFTYSLGLRAEYTDRRLNSSGTDYDYFKWNVFPTAHFGYNFDESHQVYASYSSRIQRPQGWQIEPQIIRTSINTYFQGNKDIKPELVNNVELGWAKSFEKRGTRLSFEAFYSNYRNYIQFIQEQFLEGTTINKAQNTGTVNNIGLEGNFGTNLMKWWNLELNASGYLSFLDVSISTTRKNRRTFEGSLRLNNYFTLTKSTKLQFSGRYNSRESTPLGYEGANFGFDLGLKQSFLKKALTLSLNARNIFNTRRDFGENSRDDYYYYYNQRPKWPRVNLAVTYKINNYRQSRRQNESQQGQM